MADTAVSALTALTGANAATDDVVLIIDTSVTTGKKMTLAEFGVMLGTLGIRGVLVTSAGTIQIPNGGILQFAPGVVGAPNLERSSAALNLISNEGSYAGVFLRTGSFNAQDGTTPSILQDAQVANSRQIAFSDGTDFNRGVGKGLGEGLRITNGSTGIGSLQLARPVEANVAGSGAPNVLVATESHGVLTNEGTTAENYHTLPSAAAGQVFSFVVIETDGIRVVAAAGDTVRGSTGESAAAGFIRCATVGAAITLVAINDTQWVPLSIIGTWTVDA